MKKVDQGIRGRLYEVMRLYDTFLVLEDGHRRAGTGVDSDGSVTDRVMCFGGSVVSLVAIL